MLNTQREPIAIVGIGCRFPGSANSPREFWELLKEGKDGIVEVPSDRWNVDQFYDPNPATPGKMYVRSGGFIDQKIKEFDAAFFGISPREAGFIDPQQRLLMEVAWEALEDAGLQPERLAGSDTGVYIGGFMLDNLLTQFSPLNREQIGQHSAVGSTLTILSNRLSYVFDLRGPSFTLDTACSSSLVAMHEACQAIWNGECSLALFGGVNVMYRPENLIAMCKGGFLSPDGRSKSFDIRANGYGRGEGAGIVVLKPYSAAMRDGDDIYGLVRGTGVNQDGRTDGITVPNPVAQEALIRTVLAQAHVDPHQIRYVEAHGTGTPVGDPLEARAIGAALGASRPLETPCVVGSVKANIGHLEAASGVAGLIKLALCLKNNAIPPLANLTVPNPNIPFAELGLRLPLALEPMPTGPGTPCVAINSFGYGGTNAHAILEECAPVEHVPAAAASAGQPAQYVLPLSARSKAALTALAQRYHARLSQPDSNLADVCYSAALRRGHLDQRLALVASSREEMLERLQAFIDHGPGPGIAVGSHSNKGQKPVFVTTGMGPQWWAMGRELLATEPVFRAMAEQCDAIFQRLTGWSILAEMQADESVSRILETQIAQPANFVLQVSLAALWRSKGIEPAAVVGHSVGEVSAAYIAGVLNLEDALRVSYHRSRIQKKAAGIGTMLAVGLSAAACEPFLAAHPGQLSLAAANGPTSVTLAGDTDALQQVADQLTAQGVFNRFLNVEVAYHSHTMEPLKPEMMDVLADLSLHAATVPLYSTVTGELAEPGAYDAKYWCDNIREAVLYEKTMQALLRDGYRLFLEVGPHPVLATSIKEILADQGVTGTLLTSLRRGQPESLTFHEAFAGLYCAGAAINWTAAYKGTYTKLPTYPWQREEHWHEGTQSYLDRMAVLDHGLLGRRVEGPAPVWESTLNANLLPYLHHHRVEDLVVLPGAAYVELGLAVHREEVGAPHQLLENLEFFKALIVSPNSQPRLHVSYDPASRQYAVFSREREGVAWSQHARGQLSHIPLTVPPARQLDAVRKRCLHPVAHASHYADMRGRGLQYGPYFQGVRDLWLSEDGTEALARIEGLPALGQSEHHNLLHPTLLDACFQTLLSGLALSGDQNVYVPVSIRQIRLYHALPNEFWCHSERHYHRDHALAGDVTLCDADGNVLAEVLDVRAQALTQKGQDEMAGLDQWLYQFEWEPAPRESVPEEGGSWLLLADSGQAAEALAARLNAHCAARIIVARSGPAFKQIDAGNFVLRPDSKDDMHRLLELSSELPLRGVVHLWSLDSGRHIDDIGTTNVVSAMNLVQAVAERGENLAPQLFFVTAQAQSVGQQAQVNVAQAPVIGFVRVAANEYQSLRLRLIDIDLQAEPAAALAQELLSGSREQETALRANGRYVSRLTRRTAAELTRTDHAAAGAFGQFAPRRLPAAQEVEVALDLVALPASTASGWQGAEAFGVVAAVGSAVSDLQPGERVLLLLDSQPSPFVTVPADRLLCNASLSADGVDPLQLTSLAAAWHALHNIARLKAGESVLIQNACSCLGQAAVRVARALGATIYASTATAAGRDFLRAQDLSHVFDAEAMECIDGVRALTGARGLDVVVNDGVGEVADKLHTLLGMCGRFIDTSAGHAAVPALQGNQLRASLDIIQIMRHDPALFAELTRVVQERLANGTLQPLTLQYLSAAQWAEQSEAGVCAESAGPRALDLGGAEQRIADAQGQGARFDANGTYLITGGFGGFGLQLAAWLVKQGVRNLVLCSRSGASSAQAKQAVAALQQAGANVHAAAVDIADDLAVQRLLQSVAVSMPPLKGVFHAAAVLHDAAIKVLEARKIEAVMQPKARGAWLLHQHTSHLPLDYFVLFSSVGSMVGNPGQAPYVSANAFLDALAQLRAAQNLPATAINWGALGEVGMAAQAQGVEEYLNRMGFGSFTPSQAIGAMDKVLDWKPINLGVALMDWQRARASYPNWAEAPRNSRLFAATTEGAGGVGEQGPLHALRQLEPATRLQAIEDGVLDLVSNILRVNRDKIDRDQSLLNMGMDSLMGIELQGAIEGRIGVRISTLELMKGNALFELIAQLARMVEAAAPSAAERGGGEPASASEGKLFEEMRHLDSRLSAMSDEEIGKALEELLAKGEQV